MHVLQSTAAAAGVLLAATFPGVAGAGAINLFISDSLDGLIVNQDTLSGVNSFLGSTAHFTAVSALAGPSGAANLGSVTLDVTTEAPGPHTLTIIATQTGLNFDAASTQTSFTYNGLEGAPGPNTDTMSVNGAPSVSHIFPAAVGVDAFGPVVGGPVLITSNAEEFTIDFLGGLGQRFEGTIEFIAEAQPVREASSLAIMGSSFIAAGAWAIRRKKRQAASARAVLT